MGTRAIPPSMRAAGGAKDETRLGTSVSALSLGRLYAAVHKADGPLVSACLAGWARCPYAVVGGHVVTEPVRWTP